MLIPLIDKQGRTIGKVDSNKFGDASVIQYLESGSASGRTTMGGATAQAAASAGQPAGAATSTGTAEPAQTAPTPGKCGKPIHGGKFCNRLPEHDKPSKDAEGKVVGATPCSTIPF